MIRGRIAAAICDHDIATCLLRDAHYADADEVMAGLEEELVRAGAVALDRWRHIAHPYEFLPTADWLAAAIVEAMKGET